MLKKLKLNSCMKTYKTFQKESETEVAQLCPTLHNCMDCNLSGSFVHGIFQARVLEWFTISFSRGSSQPRDGTRFSCILGISFTIWTTRPSTNNIQKKKKCPFHYRRKECKSRKSRDTWSNRQVWPWSTKWSRAKANRVLPRERTGRNKHPLPTTQEKTLHMDITRWSIPK